MRNYLLFYANLPGNFMRNCTICVCTYVARSKGSSLTYPYTSCTISREVDSCSCLLFINILALKFKRHDTNTHARTHLGTSQISNRVQVLCLISYSAFENLNPKSCWKMLMPSASFLLLYWCSSLRVYLPF